MKRENLTNYGFVFLFFFSLSLSPLALARATPISPSKIAENLEHRRSTPSDLPVFFYTFQRVFNEHAIPTAR